MLVQEVKNSSQSSKTNITPRIFICNTNYTVQKPQQGVAHLSSVRIRIEGIQVELFTY